MTKTILVMDDSALVLDAVGEALEANGFAVMKAANLADLERHCEGPAPDLFVLDVQMPEIFGDDVGQVLRGVRAMRVPIILFSNMPESVLADRARDASLDGYVSKTAGVDALVDRVASLIAAGPPS
jgi:DNA-binding response OmpR family regulator